MKQQNEQDLKGVIKSFFKTYHLENKIQEVQIKEMWEKVMGKTMMKYTNDIRLKNGTLTVFIQSAPLKNEMHFNQERIIQRLNDEFGEMVICRLEVK
ncbi:MAG: DUF721 domain-containing protein [Chitinophagales bacterium]